MGVEEVKTKVYQAAAVMTPDDLPYQAQASAQTNQPLTFAGEPVATRLIGHDADFTFSADPALDADIPRGKWKDEYLDCGNNLCPSLLMACCCPCVLASQLADRLGVAPCKHTLLAFFGLIVVAAIFQVPLLGVSLFVVAFYLRVQARRRYEIPEHNVSDCLLSFCCSSLTLAHLARHVFPYKGVSECNKFVDPYSASSLPGGDQAGLVGPVNTAVHQGYAQVVDSAV